MHLHCLKTCMKVLARYILGFEQRRVTLRENAKAAVAALLNAQIVESVAVRQNENEYLRARIERILRPRPDFFDTLSRVRRCLNEHRLLAINASTMAHVGLDEFSDEVLYSRLVDALAGVATGELDRLSAYLISCKGHLVILTEEIHRRPMT